MIESEHARYDPRTDELYVRLPVVHGEYFRTTDLGGGVFLDYDRDRVIFGVAFVGASNGVQLHDELVHRDFIIEAIQRVYPNSLNITPKSTR